MVCAAGVKGVSEVYNDEQRTILILDHICFQICYPTSPVPLPWIVSGSNRPWRWLVGILWGTGGIQAPRSEFCRAPVNSVAPSVRGCVSRGDEIRNYHLA